VVSVNVSRGAVPKLPVERARVSPAGVEGDRQRFLEFHGGPERAVSIYSLDLIEALRKEGHPIGVGTTGENLTLAGLDWSLMVPGATLRIGEAEVEITAYAAPCRTIAGSFIGRRMGRISEVKHRGWSRVYARVHADGAVWRDCVARLTSAESLAV
jgi:MOSC domain-containing protein YiiM